jgi:hypothetical protein
VGVGGLWHTYHGLPDGRVVEHATQAISGIKADGCALSVGGRFTIWLGVITRLSIANSVHHLFVRGVTS